MLDLMDPLDELIWHWGMAYKIWTAGGTWYARRNGEDQVMQADDSESLSFMIRDDYFRRAAQNRADSRARDGAKRQGSG